nr:cytochrome P450 [Streptomyces sp. Z38]
MLGIRHGYDTPAVRQEQVHRLVKEALRLYPTAWRLIRVAAADHDIAAARVSEGEHVLIGTHAIHRSAAVWDRPLDFRPSRWEQPTDDQRRSYLPFGKATACARRTASPSRPSNTSATSSSTVTGDTCGCAPASPTSAPSWPHLLAGPASPRHGTRALNRPPWLSLAFHVARSTSR